MSKFRYCRSCKNTLPLQHPEDQPLCERCAAPTLEQRIEALEEKVERLIALVNL